MEKNPISSKLPKKLKEKYVKHARKCSPAVEGLKIAAALKLWNDRHYRDIKFDVPIAIGNKTLFVKVLAKNLGGLVVGIECTSEVRLNRMCERIAQLRNCLSTDSYIIAVFPSTASEKAQKVVKFADEVWVTGKNATVTQMMFASVLHKE
jgi:hypothetical protein